MELYCAIPDLEVPKQQLQLPSFQTLLKNAMERNFYLLKIYSSQFQTTSRKIFPFQIKKFILNNRQNLCPYSALPPKKSMPLPIQSKYQKPRRPKCVKNLTTITLMDSTELQNSERKTHQFYREVLRSKTSQDDTANESKLRQKNFRKDKGKEKIMTSKGLRDRENMPAWKYTEKGQGNECLDLDEENERNANKVNIICIGGESLCSERVRILFRGRRKQELFKLKRLVKNGKLRDFFLHKDDQKGGSKAKIR